MTRSEMRNLFENKALDSGGQDRGAFAIALALLEVADAQRDIAFHLKFLGLGDATTQMGAIEYLATHLGEALKEAALLVPERD